MLVFALNYFPIAFNFLSFSLCFAFDQAVFTFILIRKQSFP